MQPSSILNYIYYFLQLVDICTFTVNIILNMKFNELCDTGITKIFRARFINVTFLLFIAVEYGQFLNCLNNSTPFSIVALWTIKS